jgi:putative intracellular protease/amidase
MRILIPIPATDFDPTEVALSWQVLRQAGHALYFTKPDATICHAVLLAARSISKRSGVCVLHGRQTTALTWRLERAAWQLARFYARFWDSGYYRTYAEAAHQSVGYMSVQAEVTRFLARPEDFHDVAPDAPNHFAKTSGIFRDSATDPSPAFVLRDGNYVSARWPGDVHVFAKTFAELLAQSPKA